MSIVVLGSDPVFRLGPSILIKRKILRLYLKKYGIDIFSLNCSIRLQLLPWRVDLLADGMNLESEPRALLENSIPISGDFIVSMREDAPEVVILTSPGLTVWRINCLANQPSSPTSSYSVPNADLSHFYDAFLSQGYLNVICSSSFMLSFFVYSSITAVEQYRLINICKSSVECDCF